MDFKYIFPNKDISISIWNKYLDDIIKILGETTFLTNYMSEYRVKELQGLINGIKSGVHNKFNSLYHLLKNIKDFTSDIVSINKINHILEFINRDYTTYSYNFHYFWFMDTDSYLLHVKKDQIELSPEIFESSTLVPDMSSKILDFLLKEGFNYYSRNKIFYNLTGNFRDNPVFYRNHPNYLGWSRHRLLETLKKSELFQEEIVPIEIEYKYENGEVFDLKGGDNFLKIKNNKRYLHRYPNLEKLGMKTDTMDRFFDAELDVLYPANTTRSPIEQPFLKYLSVGMLEMLYYLIASPKLNLSRVCEIPYIDKNILKQIITKFTRIDMHLRLNLDDWRVVTKSYLCQLLNQYLISQDVRSEIPERSQEVILQPGGKTYLKYLGEPERFLPTKVENVSEIYKSYYQNCSDVTKTREDILFDAIELGLSNQINRGMTKADICRIIFKYLSQSQYQI